MIHFDSVIFDEYIAYRNKKASQKEEKEEKEEKSPVVSYKIPAQFDDIKNWPKRSPLRCWYCMRHFDSLPLFIPKQSFRVGDKNTYNVYGNFCSFQCAYEYAYDRHMHEVNDNFMSLYRQLISTGEPFLRTPIKIHDTTEFGGIYSEEDFIARLTFWNE